MNTEEESPSPPVHTKAQHAAASLDLGHTGLVRWMTHGLRVHATTQQHGGTLDPKSARHPPAGDLRRHENTISFHGHPHIVCYE